MNARLGVTCAIMAYNEEANLDEAVREVFGELAATNRPFEILIVDAGPRPSTGAPAHPLAVQPSQPARAVPAIHQPHNRGPGSAVVTGCEQAAQPLYFFHPGDNQVRLSDVARAL